jgi:hypothetical protein
MVDTHARQLALIHGYEAKRSLAIVRKLQDTRASGRPASDESVTQPGGPRGEFRCATWYVFRWRAPRADQLPRRV